MILRQEDDIEAREIAVAFEGAELFEKFVQTVLVRDLQSIGGEGC